MHLAVAIDVGDTGFTVYWVALIVTGVALVLSTLLAGAGIWMKLLNALIGVAFAAYGVYLGLIWDGVGRYRFFPYAFILPVLLIIYAVRKWRERQAAATSDAQP
jgi:hypothetical protein